SELVYLGRQRRVESSRQSRSARRRHEKGIGRGQIPPAAQEDRSEGRQGGGHRVPRLRLQPHPQLPPARTPAPPLTGPCLPELVHLGRVHPRQEGEPAIARYLLARTRAIAQQGRIGD